MVDVEHLRPTLPLSPGPVGEGVGVGIEQRQQQQQTSSSCPAIQGRGPCVSTAESIRKKGPITGLPIVSPHRCGLFFFFKWSPHTHAPTHTHRHATNYLADLSLSSHLECRMWEEVKGISL